MILGQRGIAPRKRKSKPNDRAILINHLMVSKTKDGEPAYLVDTGCRRIIAGCSGLYRFKETKEGHVRDMIDDTEVVHLFDAKGYSIYNNLFLHFEKMWPEKKPEGPNHLAQLHRPPTYESDWLGG